MGENNETDPNAERDYLGIGVVMVWLRGGAKAVQFVIDDDWFIGDDWFGVSVNSWWTLCRRPRVHESS